MAEKIYQIAVVIPKYGLTGGAEGFAAQLTDKLAENGGYRVHVFANEWPLDHGGVTFHKVPILSFPKFMTTVSFAFFARAGISSMPFDLIHTHDRIFDADLYTMHGIPHRVWVREVRKKKRMSLFDMGTQWVEKKLVMNKRCRKFLAVSQLTREQFLQEYGNIHPEHVEVIYPGIDMGRFLKYDRASCRKEIRDRFNIDNQDIVILFASMNFDIRGLDHLMRGLAKLKERRSTSRVKLLVAGKGNTKKYMTLAQNLGLREDIIFAGIAPKDMLEKIYLTCDMFSILSLFDTFSMTALEAMAASLPVIISKNVGAKDLVLEGVNGFIVEDTGDADAVADRINRMLDSEARARMAEEAFKTASAQTWERAAGKVVEIYEEILRSKNPLLAVHPSTDPG